MRPIDADALKKAMDRYWGTCQRIRKPRNGETAVFLDVRATVEKQPTIDAEPVIRCKDCKYYKDGDCWHEWDNDGQMYYQSVINEPNLDDYCSYAERKEK